MLEKISDSNKCYSFDFFLFIKVSWNIVSVSTKNITFKEINNKEMFLEQQISILESFLKDHVTLKTGVMSLNCNI